MSDPDFQAINKLTGLLSERKDALTIRWLVSTVTIGLFALVVAWFEQGSPRVPMWLTALMWLATAVLVGLSVALPRRHLTDRHLAAQLRKPADAQIFARRTHLNPEQTRTLAELPDLEQRLFGLTMLFEQPYNLGLKLAGGLAVIGLLYGLVAGTLVEATLPLLSALALNCWHYPRLTPLVDRGRKLDSLAEDEDAVRKLTAMAPGSARRPSSTSERPPARPTAPTPNASPRLRKSRKQ